MDLGREVLSLEQELRFSSTGSGCMVDIPGGGAYRAGVIYLPQTSEGNAVDFTQIPIPTVLSRPTALDTAYPIPNATINIFNTNNGQTGLKPRGQVRSRVEAEGKYQLTASEFQSVRQSLFSLERNPAQLQQILGPQWTLSLVTRYLQTDPNGQLIRDAEGLPIPDPMVDTYYDNNSLQAAQNEMSIRYRWTQGNQTGAWNFKPGMGVTTPEGIVYRVEYGLDTTDDRPTSVQSFADSFHPLNPFQPIRQVIPGARPSDFLVPAVRITDYRYKFLLHHPSGLQIEISADDVRNESLRASGTGTFYQLEMDVDHLSTSSSSTYRYNNTPPGSYIDTARLPQFIISLSPQAFFNGRAVLHSVQDLEPTSALRTSRQNDFQLAETAIVQLRNALLPNGWVRGAQKYSYATYGVGLVSEDNASPSVRTALAGLKGNPAQTCAETLAMGNSH